MVRIQNQSEIKLMKHYFSGQIVSKKQIHKGDIKFLHNMDNKLLISGEIFSDYSHVDESYSDSDLTLIELTFHDPYKRTLLR